MGFIIAAAVAAAVIAFCFLCYKKAPPTQAIVVTGFGLSRPKVVCGRGVFVLPIVQRADRLNMRLLKIDVKTPETGVKTKEGVSLWLDSVVTVQVYSENSTVSDEEVRNAGYDDIRKYINSRQQSAISNFLGMDEAHINEKINDVLQGNLREIVSEMTVDQILTNRKQMAVSVVENARPDLAKMGLEVVTFNVQDVKDAVDAMGHNHGVIEAIGVEQEELVKKRASIAKAEAEQTGVEMRMYRVIYDAINDVTDAMKGMLAPKVREVALGEAQVRQVYKISSVGTVAGCRVTDGKITRDAQLRLVRDGIVICEDSIASLKRFKDDSKEVASCFECVITLAKFHDIKEGDVFECFKMEEYRD